MKRIRWKRLGNMSIRLKLTLTFVLLLSTMTGAISLTNLELHNRETRSQAQFSSVQALGQTSSFIENKCSAVIDTLDLLASNDTILELIREPIGGYSGNLTRWWSDATRLNTVLFSTRGNRDIRSFHLYFANGLSRISGNEDFTLLDKVVEEPWYDKLLEDPSGFRWQAPGTMRQPASEDVVTAMRKIPSRTDLRAVVGLIRADLPSRVLRDILDQGRFAPSASLALVNEAGELICVSTGFQAQDEEALRAIRAEMASNGWSDGQSQLLDAAGQNYLVGSQTIRRTDWTLTLFIPSADVQALGLHVQRRILWVFLIFAPLSIPLALWAAQSSTNRIRHLAARMRTYGSPEAPVVGQRLGDEVDELERDYQQMIERIDGLMDEKYALGVSNKNLELKALQAQINPHFLYNTLDLINMMGLRSNHPEIASLVKALAAFYRLSLGRGEDMVTVGKELDLVRAYMTIQNMRFDNCVSVQISVPADLLDVPMPKIILQPLVENAVLHGILESESERGCVTISGERNALGVVILIRDDGRGMEPAKAKALTAGVGTAVSAFATGDVAAAVSRSRGSGYGVRNICERLHILYGDPFGLSVESAPGCGTTVSVTLPDRRG